MFVNHLSMLFVKDLLSHMLQLSQLLHYLEGGVVQQTVGQWREQVIW